MTLADIPWLAFGAAASAVLIAGMPQPPQWQLSMYYGGDVWHIADGLTAADCEAQRLTWYQPRLPELQFRCEQQE